MKKILLLLFSIILWNCTDYAAEWDEKYLAESSDPENSNPFQTSSASEEKKTEPSLSSSSQDMVLVDPRDGQSYRLVTIGDQVWMAENLNYETMDSYCNGNEPVDCALYGRLYTWAAALFACPSGWHLPSEWEFKTLITAVGGEEVAGQKLKATKGWTKYDGIANEDAFGFSALPVGGYGKSAFFWSSADYDSSWTFSMMLSDDTDSAVVILQLNDMMSSVRCLKDYDAIVNPILTGNLTDSRDGQTYKTVTIGMQTWMAENLNYETKNSNCLFDKAENCARYGRLYGDWAAMNACPSGWHLPSESEFDTLITVVGGRSTAGQKLKATTGWKGAYEDAFGFSALPAGIRSCDAGWGCFFRNTAQFWSSNGCGVALFKSKDDASVICYTDAFEYYELSVRCIKD